MAYKRTTRKTSGGAKMTTTYNTNGNVRRTHTVKPTKSLTISTSVNRNGSVRTTRTNNINGWVTRKSTTSKVGPTKCKKIKIPKSSTRSYSGGRSRSRGSSKADGFIIELFFALIVLFFGAIWWVIKHFFIGLWGAAQASVKQEEKNYKWYLKSIGYFILYFWVVALLCFWAFKVLLPEETVVEPLPEIVVPLQQED